MIPGLPYLAVYSVEPAPPRTVIILRVLHEAMLWPPVKECERGFIATPDFARSDCRVFIWLTIEKFLEFCTDTVFVIC